MFNERTVVIEPIVLSDIGDASARVNQLFFCWTLILSMKCSGFGIRGEKVR
jgi:hypothetical protein